MGFRLPLKEKEGVDRGKLSEGNTSAIGPLTFGFRDGIYQALAVCATCRKERKARRQKSQEIKISLGSGVELFLHPTNSEVKWITNHCNHKKRENALTPKSTFFERSGDTETYFTFRNVKHHLLSRRSRHYFSETYIPLSGTCILPWGPTSSRGLRPLGDLHPSGTYTFRSL